MKVSALDTYRTFENEALVLRSDHAISLLLRLADQSQMDSSLIDIDSTEVQLLAKAGFITSDDGSIWLSQAGRDFLSLLALRTKNPDLVNREELDVMERLALVEMEKDYEQARLHAKRSYVLALVFSIFNAIVMVVATILLFGGALTIGIVGLVSSIVMSMISVFSFNRERGSTKRIESYQQGMVELQRIATMLRIAETIEDDSERNNIKQQIISKSIKSLSPSKNWSKRRLTG